MVFLSSPPPAPQAQSSPFFLSATKQKVPRPTFTNPLVRDNSYTQAYNQAYYTSTSPSPLRTARNANLMASPPRSNGFKNTGGLLSSSPLKGWMEDDENRVL